MIVAFEGLPGAGKTTTARLVAQLLVAESVIESTEAHPFLDSVYRDDARHDLEVELAFLLLHANAWRSIDPARRTITDFTPIKDRLFAKDMLTVKADLALFEAVYARLHDGGNDPDVVIYLKATPELALDRVRTRYERDSHREFEKGMELDRLRRIEGKYDAHRDQLGQRVLVLELAEILLSGDSEAESKQRVADAAVELLQRR